MTVFQELRLYFFATQIMIVCGRVTVVSYISIFFPQSYINYNATGHNFDSQLNFCRKLSNACGQGFTDQPMGKVLGSSTIFQSVKVL